MTRLAPGRYTVHGGPGGYLSLHKVPGIDAPGVRTIRPASASWPVLYGFKVRPGVLVTSGAAIDAALRRFELTEGDDDA